MPMMSACVRRLLWLVALACATPALSQARVPVLFEVEQETSFGRSVFVLGDIPELGGGDLSRAVKLDPSGYPLWRVSVSIPEGTGFTYRYYTREDAPGRTSDPTNGTAVSGVLTGSVDGGGGGGGGGRVVTTRLAGDATTLFWREAGTQVWNEAPMQLLERGTDASLFVAWSHDGEGFAGGSLGGGAIEFFAEASPGAVFPGEREPPFAGFHTSSLDGVHAQLGALYTYEPSALTVSPARRDYNPSSVPSLFSQEIGETRRYRVYLPRGYDEHVEKTYPLVLFHDGQNVFESGAFGSWNADEVIDDLTGRGLIREAVYVGVDHTDRFRDYIPGAGADAYVRFLTEELVPLIASRYRVRTDAGSVAAIGSSLGGVISMEMGWNHPEDFGLIGAMSGAWQVTQGTLNQQLQTGAAREIRIYMDSGDSGTANDNYWLTYGLRDALVGRASPRYSLEGTLRHVVGYGDAHNEAAWERRLPDVLGFLLPAGEDVSLLRETFAPSFDAEVNGVFDIEDAHAFTQDPVDVDGDGVGDGGDALIVVRALRRSE